MTILASVPASKRCRRKYIPRRMYSQASPTLAQTNGVHRMPRSQLKRPPRVRRTQANSLQERIKQLIDEEGLKAGDPLPTELDLVEVLDVSRNSLREALRALQAVGIVEIRHGHGMYVGRLSLGALVDELTFHGRLSETAGLADLANLVEIREVLELGLLDLVLERITPQGLERLNQAVLQMEDEAERGLLLPDTDRLFHERLYEPLGNPLVNVLLKAFWDAYQTLQSELLPPNESPVEVAHRHRRIHTSLANANRRSTRTAMASHFKGIRERLALVSD